MIKLLAYACLALAVLNTAEILGFVEPGRYVPFLPRWDVATVAPGTRQWISNAQHKIEDAQQVVGALPFGVNTQSLAEAGPALQGRYTDYIVNRRAAGS